MVDYLTKIQYNLRMSSPKETLGAQYVSPEELERIFEEINNLRPIPEEIFLPDGKSASEQKALFIDGVIRNPDFSYSRLVDEDTSLRAARLDEIKFQLPSMDVANKIAYNDIIESYQSINKFIDLTKRLKSGGENSGEVDEQWMTLNREIFGEPDEATYRSLLFEYAQKVARAPLEGRAEEIRQELLIIMPNSTTGFTGNERFTPKEETVRLASLVADTLYGRMLEGIPKKHDLYSPEDVREIFENIIRTEFGDAASGWEVVLDEATSISVQASKQLIKIPLNRKPMKYEELRGLAVHEIGVHMLRSIMARDSSVAPLRLGLSDYLESEEGLAKVMEQSIKGRYEEAKPNFYIISGLAYFDGKDFRDCFEIMWRLSVLNKFSKTYNENETDDVIESSKDFMYRQTFRIFRGTDKYPWFKDLSYYHGNQHVWQYIEDQGADFNTLSLMLMGKADPTNDSHRRVLLESHTVI